MDDGSESMALDHPWNIYPAVRVKSELRSKTAFRPTRRKQREFQKLGEKELKYSPTHRFQCQTTREVSVIHYIRHLNHLFASDASISSQSHSQILTALSEVESGSHLNPVVNERLFRRLIRNVAFNQDYCPLPSLNWLKSNTLTIDLITRQQNNFDTYSLESLLPLKNCQVKLNHCESTAYESVLRNCFVKLDRLNLQADVHENAGSVQPQEKIEIIEISDDSSEDESLCRRSQRRKRRKLLSHTSWPKRRKIPRKSKNDCLLSVSGIVKSLTFQKCTRLSTLRSKNTTENSEFLRSGSGCAYQFDNDIFDPEFVLVSSDSEDSCFERCSDGGFTECRKKSGSDESFTNIEITPVRVVLTRLETDSSLLALVKNGEVKAHVEKRQEQRLPSISSERMGANDVPNESSVSELSSHKLSQRTEYISDQSLNSRAAVSNCPQVILSRLECDPLAYKLAETERKEKSDFDDKVSFSVDKSVKLGRRRKRSIFSRVTQFKSTFSKDIVLSSTLQVTLTRLTPGFFNGNFTEDQSSESTVEKQTSPTLLSIAESERDNEMCSGPDNKSQCVKDSSLESENSELSINTRQTCSHSSTNSVSSFPAINVSLASTMQVVLTRLKNVPSLFDDGEVVEAIDLQTKCDENESCPQSLSDDTEEVCTAPSYPSSVATSVFESQNDDKDHEKDEDEHKDCLLEDSSASYTPDENVIRLTSEEDGCKEFYDVENGFSISNQKKESKNHSQICLDSGDDDGNKDLMQTDTTDDKEETTNSCVESRSQTVDDGDKKSMQTDTTDDKEETTNSCVESRSQTADDGDRKSMQTDTTDDKEETTNSCVENGSQTGDDGNRKSMQTDTTDDKEETTNSCVESGSQTGDDGDRKSMQTDTTDDKEEMTNSSVESGSQTGDDGDRKSMQTDTTDDKEEMTNSSVESGSQTGDDGDRKSMQTDTTDDKEETTNSDVDGEISLESGKMKSCFVIVSSFSDQLQNFDCVDGKTRQVSPDPQKSSNVSHKKTKSPNKPLLVSDYIYSRADSVARFCRICQQKLLTTKAFQKHLKKVHCTNAPFTCSWCNNTFFTFFGVVVHKNMMHPNSKLTFYCRQCDVCFDDLPTLKEHLIEHGFQLPLACSVCYYHFDSIEEMESHEINVHSKTLGLKRKADAKVDEEATNDSNNGGDGDSESLNMSLSLNKMEMKRKKNEMAKKIKMRNLKRKDFRQSDRLRILRFKHYQSLVSKGRDSQPELRRRHRKSVRLASLYLKQNCVLDTSSASDSEEYNDPHDKDWAATMEIVEETTPTSKRKRILRPSRTHSRATDHQIRRKTRSTAAVVGSCEARPEEAVKDQEETASPAPEVRKQAARKSATFRRKDNAKRPLRTRTKHSTLVPSNPSQSEQIVRLFHCPICRKGFINEYSMRQHTRKKHRHHPFSKVVLGIEQTVQTPAVSELTNQSGWSYPRIITNFKKSEVVEETSDSLVSFVNAAFLYQNNQTEPSKQSSLERPNRQEECVSKTAVEHQSPSDEMIQQKSQEKPSNGCQSQDLPHEVSQMLSEKDYQTQQISAKAQTRDKKLFKEQRQKTVVFHKILTTKPSSTQPSQEPQILQSQPRTLPSRRQTLRSQPQTFPSQPQTLPSQPQRFPSQPQTLSSQPQTLPSQPQTLSSQPQTLASQPQTLSSQPQTFPSQPQALSSQPQTFPSQPQTLPSQPQTFPSQPQTLPSQPQTLSSQPQTFPSQPQALSSQPQTLPSQPQTFPSQPQTLSLQPQALPSQPQTLSSQPQTLPSQPQTLPSQPQTLSSQPQILSLQPQTFPSQPQTLSLQPQTLPSQPQTFPSQPQTLPSQPQTFPSQPETLSSQPQTFPSQPQTLPSQPETLSSQPQTLPSQPQTFPSQPETLSSQLQTLPSQQQTLSAHTFQVQTLPAIIFQPQTLVSIPSERQRQTSSTEATISQPPPLPDQIVHQSVVVQPSSGTPSVLKSPPIEPSPGNFLQSLSEPLTQSDLQCVSTVSTEPFAYSQLFIQPIPQTEPPSLAQLLDQPKTLPDFDFLSKKPQAQSSADREKRLDCTTQHPRASLEKDPQMSSIDQFVLSPEANHLIDMLVPSSEAHQNLQSVPIESQVESGQFLSKLLSPADSSFSPPFVSPTHPRGSPKRLEPHQSQSCYLLPSSPHTQTSHCIPHSLTPPIPFLSPPKYSRTLQIFPQLTYSQTSPLSFSQHSAGPQVSQHSAGPQILQHSAAPQISQHSAGPQILQHSAGPQILQHSAGPQISQHSAAPQISQHSAAPQIPQHSAAPQIPQHSAEPQILQHSAAPQIFQHSAEPQIPQHSAAPQIPQHSAGPQVSQHSAAPQIPEHSAGPQIPQHSAMSQTFPQTSCGYTSFFLPFSSSHSGSYLLPPFCQLAQSSTFSPPSSSPSSFSAFSTSLPVPHLQPSPPQPSPPSLRAPSAPHHLPQRSPQPPRRRSALFSASLPLGTPPLPQNSSGQSHRAPSRSFRPIRPTPVSISGLRRTQPPTPTDELNTGEFLLIGDHENRVIGQANFPQ